MVKKKQRKYTITLTEEQMILIAGCVEDIHRFLAGRTELWNTASVLDNARDVRYRMAEMAKVVTPELGRGMEYDWAGNGCPNEHQKKMIAQTYYLYREMLHQYTIANKHKNVYTSETLRCKDSGEPIKITKDKRESPRLQSWDESASMVFLILDISDYGISRNTSDRLAEIRTRPQRRQTGAQLCKFLTQNSR